MENCLVTHGVGLDFETFPPEGVEDSLLWNDIRTRIAELLVGEPDKIYAVETWLEYDGRPIDTGDGQVDCVLYLVGEVLGLDERGGLGKELVDFYLNVCKGTGGVYKLVGEALVMAGEGG